MKKKRARLYSKIFAVKLTPDQYRAIKKFKEEYGYRFFSDIFRRHLTTFVNVSDPLLELRNEDRENLGDSATIKLVSEINKIGVNLNQISKNLNSLVAGGFKNKDKELSKLQFELGCSLRELRELLDLYTKRQYDKSDKVTD